MPRAQKNWLTRLISESGSELVRYIGRRVANRSEAEDLAQEVYLRLLRIEDPGAIRNPRAFALRLAANVAYEWRMTARNRFEHTDEAPELEDDRADPYRELLNDQEMQRLIHVLESLTPMQRAIVLLHRRDGYTYEQIAKTVGLSVQMVYKHLAKSIALCKERLQS